jgi:hypothetical protein
MDPDPIGSVGLEVDLEESARFDLQNGHFPQDQPAGLGP